MDSENAIEMVTSQTTNSLEVSSRNQLGDLSSDEIFQTIKQINAGLEQTPSVFGQAFSAGQRELAKAIEESKIMEVEARKNLIKGLSEQVSVYVKARKSLLKAKAEKIVTGTFDCILLDLAYVNDKVISGYLNVYRDFVRGIEVMKDLPEEIRQTAITNAAERLKIRSEQSQQSIYKLTENLREEIIRFNCETGKC